MIEIKEILTRLANGRSIRSTSDTLGIHCCRSGEFRVLSASMYEMDFKVW